MPQRHKFFNSWILKFLERLEGSFETPSKDICAWDNALHLKQSLSEDAIYICSKQKGAEGERAAQYYKAEHIRHMIVWLRCIFIAFLFTSIFIMLLFILFLSAPVPIISLTGTLCYGLKSDFHHLKPMYIYSRHEAFILWIFQKSKKLCRYTLWKMYIHIIPCYMQCILSLPQFSLFFF